MQVGPDGESRCWRVERDQAGDCRATVAPLGWDPTTISDEAVIRVAAAGLAAGTEVVVTGHGRGERRDGGFATHVRVPATAVIPLPAGLSSRDAMALGTAGLTALLACSRTPAAASPLAALGAGQVVPPAAIGMAGGAELATTVHPFILRGVTLAGIDAATLPSQDDRRRLWTRLAEFWPTVRGHLPVTVVRLDEVGRQATRMLAGETIGRAVVVP